VPDNTMAGSITAPDSITVEVIRHSILASAQEMARNLCRTAYNTVVYEIHDYGIGIHEAEGNVVADTPGIAIFTGANDFGVQNTVWVPGPGQFAPWRRLRPQLPLLVLCPHARRPGVRPYLQVGRADRLRLVPCPPARPEG
jgi:hypothetical protein